MTLRQSCSGTPIGNGDEPMHCHTWVSCGRSEGPPRLDPTQVQKNHQRPSTFAHAVCGNLRTPYNKSFQQEGRSRLRPLRGHRVGAKFSSQCCRRTSNAMVVQYMTRTRPNTHIRCRWTQLSCQLDMAHRTTRRSRAWTHREPHNRQTTPWRTFRAFWWGRWLPTWLLQQKNDFFASCSCCFCYCFLIDVVVDDAVCVACVIATVDEFITVCRKDVTDTKNVWVALFCR